MNYNYLLELSSLIILESVLGIDNLIFISIIVNNLSGNLRKKIRYLAISLAVIIRIFLLLITSHIMKMTNIALQIGKFAFSWQELLMIFGGVFLLFKATKEIFHLFSEKNEHKIQKNNSLTNVFYVTLQLVFVDILLSIDSIITAIAITDHLNIIIISMIISIFIMLFFTNSLSNFVQNNIQIKVLCLNFINLIGIFLTLEGFNINISKNYLYSAMVFGILNEYIIIKLKRQS